MAASARAARGGEVARRRPCLGDADGHGAERGQLPEQVRVHGPMVGRSARAWTSRRTARRASPRMPASVSAAGARRKSTRSVHAGQRAAAYPSALRARRSYLYVGANAIAPSSKPPNAAPARIDARSWSSASSSSRESACAPGSRAASLRARPSSPGGGGGVGGLVGRGRRVGRGAEPDRLEQRAERAARGRRAAAARRARARGLGRRGQRRASSRRWLRPPSQATSSWSSTPSRSSLEPPLIAEIASRSNQIRARGGSERKRSEAARERKRALPFALKSPRSTRARGFGRHVRVGARERARRGIARRGGRGRRQQRSSSDWPCAPMRSERDGGASRERGRDLLARGRALAARRRGRAVGPRRSRTRRRARPSARRRR